MKYINFNNWRAVAHTFYGDEHFLYMGTSMEQVKKNYPGSFYEILEKEEQNNINRIALEKWVGKPSSGKWILQENLKIPRIHKSAV